MASDSQGMQYVRRLSWHQERLHHVSTDLGSWGYSAQLLLRHQFVALIGSPAPGERITASLRLGTPERNKAEPDLIRWPRRHLGLFCDSESDSRGSSIDKHASRKKTAPKPPPRQGPPQAHPGRQLRVTVLKAGALVHSP
jgi:hypothetical protein